MKVQSDQAVALGVLWSPASHWRHRVLPKTLLPEGWKHRRRARVKPA